MAFLQFKFDQVTFQSRDIFNTYIYETDDTISEVLTTGYFDACRFAQSDDWVGSIIQCKCSDTYAEVYALANGVTELVMPAAADVVSKAQTLSDAVAYAEARLQVGSITYVIDKGVHYQLIDAGSSGARPDEDIATEHVNGGSGGLYLYTEITNEINAIKFGVSTTGDNTTAFQNIIAYGEATGLRTVLLNIGSYQCGNLQTDFGGWHFKGRSGDRTAQGGTRIIFKGSTGDWLTLGSDDSLPWSDNLYNGPQVLVLEDINIVNDSVNRTTALNCKPDAFYHVGSAAVRDWRGGHVECRGQVWIEGFDETIWGVNSDINRIDNLVQTYCKHGLYIGPRSDQALLNRIYSFYCDTWLVIDGASHTTVNNPIQVNCGSATDNAIIIKRGVRDVVFNQPWFEGLTGIVDTKPYIGIGLVDGYGTNTDPVVGVAINNPLISVAGSGTFGANYLIEIGVADRVSQTNLNAPNVQSTLTNLTAMCLFSTGYAHDSSEYTLTTDKAIGNAKVYANAGTGSPKVHYLMVNNGWEFASNTGRLTLKDLDASAGADYLVIGQENLAGRVKFTATNYTGGQIDRLDLRRSIKDVTTMPTSGTYEAGDYARNTARTVLGSASSQYVINGWSRITTGSAHVLNVDWVEDRGLTGT